MDTTSNSRIADKVVENGMKYSFLHATVLTIPYLGLKVLDKVLNTPSNNKKTAGAVAAVAGIAALIGLTDDVDIS